MGFTKEKSLHTFLCIRFFLIKKISYYIVLKIMLFSIQHKPSQITITFVLLDSNPYSCVTYKKSQRKQCEYTRPVYILNHFGL
ncbi:hypothetical protein Hanom_Chr05g00438681 [Helianthus anomalus]